MARSGAGDLREVVNALQAKLDPDHQSKLEQARKRVSEAEALSSHAASRKVGANNAAERWVKQRLTSPYGRR